VKAVVSLEGHNIKLVAFEVPKGVSKLGTQPGLSMEHRNIFLIHKSTTHSIH
jgi:hypothetical protein